jgi:beta-glucosidase
LDNYEWTEGFEPRFGLVEVDYLTGNRKVRNSAYFYKEMIEQFFKTKI